MDDIDRLKLRLTQDPKSVTIGEVMEIGSDHMQHHGPLMLLSIGVGAMVAMGLDKAQVHAMVDGLFDEIANTVADTTDPMEVIDEGARRIREVRKPPTSH